MDNPVADNQHHEEAPRPKKILRLVYKFILISVAAHVVGLLIFGSFIIFKRMQPEQVQFESPVNLKRVEPKKREYKMRVKEQQSRASRPKIQPRLQSVRPSPLAMPTIDTKISPVKTELSDLPGLSDGLGEGLGFGGGLGELTSFGYTLATSGTLEATLIDLKRDESGNPIGPESKGGRTKAIRRFTDSNWDLAHLTTKYYAADKKLYASYWIIGMTHASEAPKAFGVEGDIEPSGILAFYEGSFIPAKDMRMRFVGAADDVIVIRLDNRIVFDGSRDNGFSKFDIKKTPQEAPIAGMNTKTSFGSWINFQKGRSYDLKILLAEVPGGRFGCMLFYQIKGDDKMRVFTTKSFTEKEKKVLSKVHPFVAEGLD